jgi:pimeloyl-ACP methyl ester carboxylesterase
MTIERAALDPPPTCPIGWQPDALSPVFFGFRDLGPAGGAPVDLRVFFPSVDDDPTTATILAGCGGYPLILLAHGHCFLDRANYLRWFQLPAQLARAGYVVVVPRLPDIENGTHPATPDHPDLLTLNIVLTWARSGWEHADLLLAPPMTGLAGHSFGAMLSARFALQAPVRAYAGLSGTWDDWLQGPVPVPLRSLAVPNLLVWGGQGDSFTDIGALWDQLVDPRHRVVFEDGEHWDYLPDTDIPCMRAHGPCDGFALAVADLVTMFFGRYLPAELAVDIIERVPASLVPPGLDLTEEQQPFAGGFLIGLSTIRDRAGCEVAIDQVAPKSPWSDNVPVPNQLSKAAPALASHNDLLHMLHLGDSSNTIYHSVWDGNGWQPNERVPGQRSKASCALASHDGLLHMVHLGDSSNDIWHSVWDGNGWQPNERIPGQQSKAACALASHQGLLHMVHLGDTSNDIWHSISDGRSWTRNVRVPGQQSKAACALASRFELLHVAHLGDTSNRIWHSMWENFARPPGPIP